MPYIGHLRCESLHPIYSFICAQMEGYMDPTEVSASHGETIIDHVWKRKLEKAIRDTKPAANLKEAVAPLAIFDEIYMEGVWRR